MNIVFLGGVESVWTDCINCGVRYTVPVSMWDHHQKVGGYHHCPNGHSQGWSKDGCENSRLRRERDRLKQQIACKDDEIEAERRRTIAQTTKLRNRAKAGTCPCCKRTFRQLALHMKNQHPDFAPDAPDLKIVAGGRSA